MTSTLRLLPFIFNQWFWVGCLIALAGELINALASSRSIKSWGVVLAVGGFLVMVSTIWYDYATIWFWVGGLIALAGELINALASNRSIKSWGVALVFGGLLAMVLTAWHDYATIFSRGSN